MKVGKPLEHLYVIRKGAVRLADILWTIGSWFVAAALWLGPMLLRADLFNGDASHHVYAYIVGHGATPTLSGF